MGMLFCLHPKFLGGTYKAFKDGREGVEDEQRAGRPSTSRTENSVARVKAVLDRDRRLNVRLIAEEVGLAKTDVHRIITEDLYMRKICAKLVPKNLSDVWEFLVQNNTTTLPHPPYSPTWLRAISSYSPSSKSTSKDIILGQLKTSS